MSTHTFGGEIANGYVSKLIFSLASLPKRQDSGHPLPVQSGQVLKANQSL